MSRNWIRACSLKIDVASQGQSQSGVGGGGLGFNLSGSPSGTDTLDLSELRIKFTIFRHTIQTPNESWIRIYNLSRSTTTRLLQAAAGEGKYALTLSAGYKDSSGPIYKGNMWFAVIGRESPTDTFIDIQCKDGGELMASGTVSKTFPAGSKQQEHMDYLKQVAEQFGVKEGETKNLLTDKYPKSFSMFGMFGDAWRTLGRSNDNRTYIDMMKMYTVPLDHSAGEIQLDEMSGLIGIPQVTTKGIIITALINPVFRPDATIVLDSSKIRQMELPPGYEGLIKTQTANQMMGIGDGKYKISSIEYRGDTRGQEWYAIMSCFGAKTGAPTGDQMKDLWGTL